jgi:hypothetical protein
VQDPTGLKEKVCGMKKVLKTQIQTIQALQ